MGRAKFDAAYGRLAKRPANTHGRAEVPFLVARSRMIFRDDALSRGNLIGETSLARTNSEAVRPGADIGTNPDEQVKVFR